MPKIEIGLPMRPFLYTLDQLADLLAVSKQNLCKEYIYFADYSVGSRPPTRMLARDIDPREDRHDWRVAEEEVRRWFKRMGFRVYDRSSLKI